MKIICIGRNYINHVKELNNKVPEEPVIFMKPDSALLRNNDDFFIPDFANDFHYETELVVKIKKVGKGIHRKFAHRYYDYIGMGIDFTARDLQQNLKQKGLPWEISKAFDSSAAISKTFIHKDKFTDINNLNFSLLINNEIKQQGNTKDMIFSIDEIIEYVSKFFTLKIGDLIYTGTPEGVGSLKIGQRLQVFLEDIEMLNFNIR